jgi:chromosome partitioning protein
MAVVLALISQKGGVGKSTLARALGAVAAAAGLKVRIADLDPQQGTVVRWEQARRMQPQLPTLDVRGYVGVEAALAEAADLELLVIDAPGRTNETTATLARVSHIIVQPTGPSVDDLHPAVLLFHELVAAGIDKSRLVFALTRTLNTREERDARAYLEAAGYMVLPGALPERSGYRDAQNRGRAVTETDAKDLNRRADDLILALMMRVVAEMKTGADRQHAGKIDREVG